MTRKISASDAVQIAGIKDLVAGLVNLGIALSLHDSLPALGTMLSAAVIGFCAYSLSLGFFVLALRSLGAARTDAYFSEAPFVGAAISPLMLQEAQGSGFGVASLLMAAGIWLHLSEKQTHAHTATQHVHAHGHDGHHQHSHDFP
ncbi:MAG: hypothetical protein ACJ8G3_19820 [Burkholderiaceae bacterium]